MTDRAGWITIDVKPSKDGSCLNGALTMRILICDDDTTELSDLKQIVETYAAAHPELQVELCCFSNPYEVLLQAAEQGVPDIALLDICMPGLMGTEIAQELQRQSGGGTDILFLTSSEEFTTEAASLRAQAYLQKPDTSVGLTAVLDQVIEKRQKRFYTLTQCREPQTIDLEAVLYGECRDGKLVIHLQSGGQVTSWMSLEVFAEVFRGRSGYMMVGNAVVNLRFVQNLQPAALVMSNGVQLPVPRRLRRDLKKRYFDFYREEAMRL